MPITNFKLNKTKCIGIAKIYHKKIPLSIWNSQEINKSHLQADVGLLLMAEMIQTICKILEKIILYILMIIFKQTLNIIIMKEL